MGLFDKMSVLWILKGEKRMAFIAFLAFFENVLFSNNFIYFVIEVFISFIFLEKPASV